ncbi:MAG: BBP7 family outer membrane beta-barrel protein [Planctomycetaceae bacterium]
MTSSRIMQTFAFMLALAAMGVPAIAQYRPVPSQHQEYHKPHKYLPGYSVPSTEFIHTPNFSNDPMCCECEDCRGVHHRPLVTLGEIYHTRLSPAVWGPSLLGTARHYSGVDRYKFRFYGGVEYMRWTTNSPSIQPLITTSPVGTDAEDAGVLGLGTTSTLFGGELFEDQRNGGRYTGAIVLDGQQRFILEAIYTTIGEDELFYRGDSSVRDVIARPFYNSTISEDDSRLVVFPDLADGRVDITGSTTFETFQISMRRALGEVMGAYTDYTIGYRRADLGDSLEIFDVTNSLAGATAGSRFEVRDQFRTRNHFDGIDFGLVSRWQANDRLSLDVLGKVALGRSQSTVKINGRTITRPPGGDRTGSPGGLLAQPTNIGTSRNSGFATMFEVGATMRYKFTKHMQGTLGYTFLSWSDVARVADQLDDAVNTSQFGGGALVGDPRPSFRHREGNFTANGLRLGVQITF